MKKCNDCWCNHYDESRGNCDNCVKNETVKDNPSLKAILKRRAVKQMGIDRKNKKKGKFDKKEKNNGCYK